MCVYVYMYIYIYIYMCIYMCVCVYTVVPWYPREIGSRTPVNTKIHRCSSPLYKTLYNGIVQSALHIRRYGEPTICMRERERGGENDKVHYVLGNVQVLG